jgi:hypothetical protein
MLVCPKCKSEYQEGYSVCNDCNCDLIEIPEITEESNTNKNASKIIQFVLGILLVLLTPIISYKLTSMYFIPNGTGQYDNEQFIWMLKAYQYSFLFVGGINCLPYIFHCCKNHKK